ncbi:ABC transporter permease [Jiangella muralis]|uniref:ABC transporter permease n=1 Tax=Jiangella muralis TaxID=702383 RepID=UPI0009F8B079|nr:ABC transporter permease [Jiangella muralis]
MGRLILRKAVVLVVSALAGSIVVFLLLRLLGGDVATVILGPGASPEARAELRSELGLDRSLIEQYLSWMGGLVRGDLGRSYAAGYDIFSEIVARLSLTVSLAATALILSWIVGLALGTYSALHLEEKRGGAIDLIAQLGISIPTFWAGLLLITFVSVQLGWLPTGGYVPWSESVTGAIRSLILPVLAISVTVLAPVFSRYVRSSMVEVLREDYIRTAMAKGRTLRQAAVTHGIRNASIALVTVATLQLGSIVTGVVVVEMVFTLPGLGRMMITAVTSREVVVVQSLAFLTILFVLVLHFLMDIAYGLLDPRVRDAEKAGSHGR